MITVYNTDEWIKPGTIVYTINDYNPFLLSLTSQPWDSMGKIHTNDLFLYVSGEIIHFGMNKNTTYNFILLHNENLYKV